MSGGFFDYNQFKINDMFDTLEHALARDSIDEWVCADNPEVTQQLHEGLRLLQLAAIYAHRIDWLLSGDDGPDTFLERLQDDLKAAGLQAQPQKVT
jgi:hypothetical protein